MKIWLHITLSTNLYPTNKNIVLSTSKPMRSIKRKLRSSRNLNASFVVFVPKVGKKKYTDFNHSEIKGDKYRNMVWKSNMSDNLIFTKFRMIIYNMMNKLWHNRWICNIPINSCCRDNSHGFTFWNFILEDFHSFQLTFPIFCERTTKKIY